MLHERAVGLVKKPRRSEARNQSRSAGNRLSSPPLCDAERFHPAAKCL